MRREEAECVWHARREVLVARPRPWRGMNEHGREEGRGVGGGHGHGMNMDMGHESETRERARTTAIVCLGSGLRKEG